jgi:hypothetical protein
MSSIEQVAAIYRRPQWGALRRLPAALPAASECAEEH